MSSPVRGHFASLQAHRQNVHRWSRLLSGLMAVVVTLLAIPGVEGWAIAPVLGLLVGAVGWLAADATWGSQPPIDGGGWRR